MSVELPAHEYVFEYVPGDLVEGVVREITPQTVYAVLRDGADAVIPLAQLDWTLEGAREVRSELRVGAPIEAVVLSRDEAQGALVLSVRELKPDPAEAFLASLDVGAKVVGEVRLVRARCLELDLGAGIIGVIAAEELSWTEEVPTSAFKIGDMLEASVLATPNPAIRRVRLGLRQLRPKPCFLYDDESARWRAFGATIDPAAELGAQVEAHDELMEDLALAGITTRHIPPVTEQQLGELEEETLLWLWSDVDRMVIAYALPRIDPPRQLAEALDALNGRAFRGAADLDEIDRRHAARLFAALGLHEEGFELDEPPTLVNCWAGRAALTIADKSAWIAPTVPDALTRRYTRVVAIRRIC